jgi:hypothetical protein
MKRKIAVGLFMTIFLATGVPSLAQKSDDWTKLSRPQPANPTPNKVAQENDDLWKMPGTQPANTRRNKVITSKYWRSPVVACSLLSDIPGMQTRGYQDLGYEYVYGCSSPSKEIGPRTVFSTSNNIVYYVLGNRSVAKELQLVLNVNNRDFARSGHETLTVLAAMLAQRALKQELSEAVLQALIGGRTGDEAVLQALIAGRAGEWRAGNTRIEVFREDWSTGKGYEVKFIIR